jgi:hypothetical protein
VYYDEVSVYSLGITLNVQQWNILSLFILSSMFSWGNISEYESI